MSQKVIVLSRDGKEEIYPLKAEKTILGRDKSCDIVLDDVSISRRHAAIIFRFEKIYIENISPSGQIFKAGKATEYAELDENVEISIGPYVLTWRTAHAPSLASNIGDVSAEAPELSSASSTPESTLPSASSGDSSEHEVAFHQDAMIGALAPYNQNGLNNAGDELEDASPAGFSAQDFAAISESENTQVSHRQAIPKLRVTKGENIGREIKLNVGSVWVVGRSRKAHVHIDNPKLSRQHFKIIKINNRFRIQDMGSSMGTKLNGVTVADAPLQAFDTIQAGPVELQFLMVDSNYQHVELPQPASAALLQAPNLSVAAAKEDYDHNKSTIVNIPVPYDPTRAQESFGNASSYKAGHAEEEEWREDEAGESDNPAIKRLPPWLIQLKRKRAELQRLWQELPPQKRYIYAGSGAVLLLLLIFNSLGGETSVNTTPITAKKDPPSLAEDAEINIAQSPDISPTYYALSLDKQNLIRKLYADAERAESKGQWQEALDASSKILELVDKYKRTKDIMLQAQAQINESYFKNTNSIEDAQDAAAKSKDQIQILMDSGTLALTQKRWADAEEAFISVLTLDPNNKEAQKGLIAARNKDPMAQYEEPQNEIVQVDPEIEEKKKEYEVLSGLKTQYQIAADYVRGPEFRKAIPILKDLDAKLNTLIKEYSEGRAPASIRDELSMNATQMQSLVEEAYFQALSQLDIEYQTQLADADQYVANRQYVQARQQYDQILAREPYYDKVRVARERLYVKIIAEAKSLYRGAVIYESVGDLRAAVAGLQKTKDLLENVKDYEAVEYYMKAEARLAYLRR
jgi:pSer/pThr/pTyr-binding forkhead associated (FHA) protein